MMIKSIKFVAIILLVFSLATTACQPGAPALVNLAHLDRLCEDVTIQGVPCTIVHIYSDAPDYGWTDASGEGIACLDDGARAAVVYIQAGNLDKDSRHDPRIRRLLNFVLAMQAEDGTFYNFVDKDLAINRTGATSQKSFGFWAARGYWALGEGYAYYREIDPPFASRLQNAYLRCLPQLQKVLQNYGKYETINHQAYPTWLLNRYAADATSEFLLGAAAYLAVAPQPDLLKGAAQLADGLVAMQASADSIMNGAFYSWPGYWHAWGNAQMHALAALSSATGDRKWLLQTEIGGRAFLCKLIAGHWLHEYDFAAGRAAGLSADRL